MTRKNSFYGFPPVSAKAWKQQIQFGLRGKDYNELLVWDSPDQIKVKPFYTAEDLEHHAIPEADVPDSWKVGQIIPAGDVQTASEKAAKSVENGAETLFFSGIPANFDPAELLAGIDLQKIPVHFELMQAPQTFSNFEKILKNIGDPSVFIHFDVIGNLARTGNWHQSMKADLEAFTTLVKEIPHCHTVSIDATLYQNAGANRIQQLAYSLAHANEYMHYLQSDTPGIPLPAPVFRIAIDSNYFFELAKLRALRMLWATLAREYGAPEQCYIIAQPSKRNKTLYEYNANMLRTTMECMAAVNGGADAVFNLPYDALYHKDNEFGDRVARNQLLILKEEAYLGVVCNPADGAYYIETLTMQLAEKALEIFKSVEASGGFLSALKKHSIQKKIREQAEKEQERFDKGEEVLVGSNAYKNSSDTMKVNIEISPFAEKRAEKTLIEPILEKRLAEKSEKKRLDHE